MAGAIGAVLGGYVTDQTECNYAASTLGLSSTLACCTGNAAYAGSGWPPWCFFIHSSFHSVSADDSLQQPATMRKVAFDSAPARHEASPPPAHVVATSGREGGGSSALRKVEEEAPGAGAPAAVPAHSRLRPQHDGPSPP